MIPRTSAFPKLGNVRDNPSGQPARKLPVGFMNRGDWQVVRFRVISTEIDMQLYTNWLPSRRTEDVKSCNLVQSLELENGCVPSLNIRLLFATQQVKTRNLVGTYLNTSLMRMRLQAMRMNPMNEETSLSYLVSILLNDFIQLKNRSTV